MVHETNKDYLAYKIKKNYIKYIGKNDTKYLNKILHIVQIKTFSFTGGGNNNSNVNFGLDFVLKNINIIINDIDFFNKILLIIENHDNLMIKINHNYKKFDYNENIIEYLDKIYNQEFILV
jgi:hypothetical protein